MAPPFIRMVSASCSILSIEVKEVSIPNYRTLPVNSSRFTLSCSLTAWTDSLDQVSALQQETPLHSTAAAAALTISPPWTSYLLCRKILQSKTCRPMRRKYTWAYAGVNFKQFVAFAGLLLGSSLEVDYY
jgi:hypothetical protein